jgi:hypothetical protein
VFDNSVWYLAALRHKYFQKTDLGLRYRLQEADFPYNGILQTAALHSLSIKIVSKMKYDGFAP